MIPTIGCQWVGAGPNDLSAFREASWTLILKPETLDSKRPRRLPVFSHDFGLAFKDRFRVVFQWFGDLGFQGVKFRDLGLGFRLWSFGRLWLRSFWVESSGSRAEGVGVRGYMISRVFGFGAALLPRQKSRGMVALKIRLISYYF